MGKIILLTVLLVLVPNIGPAQNYTPIKEDYNSVASMLDGLEKDMNTVPKSSLVDKEIKPELKQLPKQTLSQAAKQEPKLAPKLAPKLTKPTLEPEAVQGDDVYDFGYMQKHDDDEVAGYGRVAGLYGERGNFIMSFIGGIIDYPAANKGKFEGGIEIGWQMNLSKYFSFVLTSGFDIRKSSQAGTNLYPISLKGGLRARLNPWLYVFGEGGIEFVKVSSLPDWQYPSKVYGGGFLFRMGAADKKAEYNLYKAVRITRIMLILAMDAIRVKNVSDATPDGYLFKTGLSLEF